MLGRNLSRVFMFLVCFHSLTAEVGDPCRMKYTNESGVCKIINDCPGADEEARRPNALTLCGYYRYTTPIVCCANSDINTRFKFVFPDTIISKSNFETRRISERKCEEYSKNISTVVQALPLVADAEPINQVIVKCPFNTVPLIVGGRPVSPEEFPFMVAIGYDDEENKWKCGGTLISDRFVLTAAHCASIQRGFPTVVRVGEIYLKFKADDEDDSKHNDYRISRIFVHPYYRKPIKYNDIALLETEKRISFSKSVRPACLYTNSTFDFDTSIATGWGTTAFAGESSEVLRKVTLNIYDNSICNQRYHIRDELPEGITSSMVCAGDLKGGKDTCQGDSGGPLVARYEENQCKFYLIGVTAFGSACALANTPAIYTRVSQYIPWIEKIVWPEE